MPEKPETTTPDDEKHSFNWGFIVWPVVILFLYVLSWGPVMMMKEKGRISSSDGFVWNFYAPLAWAYFGAPLHKPLGLYLHLWVPKYFDKDGNERPLFH
jgi:hypothetical protein